MSVRMLAYGTDTDSFVTVWRAFDSVCPNRYKRHILWTSKYYEATWADTSDGYVMYFHRKDYDMNEVDCRLLLGESIEGLTDEVISLSKRLTEEDQTIVREYMLSNYERYKPTLKQMLRKND